MNDPKILKPDEDYKHDLSTELLKDVREFFQTKLRIIVPEWITEKNVNEVSSGNRFTEIFFIPKGSEPIYKTCNGCDDLERILDLFEDRINALLDGIDALLDKNTDLDEESKDSLDSYANAIDKCISVYGLQRQRRMTKFKESSTVDELREELRQLFSDIILNYIISVLFDALYERLKNNSGIIYEMVVKEINKFLAENGVYTKSVKVGEPIDPEFMEPTSDSAENYTDDFSKFDKIDEIRRYPYFFTDGCKITDGYARIWRRKD